jgi:hypothetical protein
VKNKEISELTYVEVRDIILKARHQKAPGKDGITAEILQKLGAALWRKINGLRLYGIRKKYP